MTRLIIASPNYSSWSLRAWVLLKGLNIPFETICLSLASPEDFKKDINKYSKAGRVPVLIHNDMQVWDSLAIIETVNDLFPNAGVYPNDLQQRAQSRSMCAEMHTGFMAMRQALPMNIRAKFTGMILTHEVKHDIARIIELWLLAIKQRQSGDFLFGDFSAVDAYFAPVVFRFATYGVTVPAVVENYMRNLIDFPATKAWIAMDDRHEWVQDDEPYQNPPEAAN